MKKRFLVLILLALIAIAVPLLASAESQSGACGGNLTWTLDNDGLLTISGTGAMNNYEFKYYDDGEEIKLFSSAPWGEADVRRIVIQPGAVTIGNYAFTYLDNLTSVTIPNSVTAIGYCSFHNCIGLTSITIPNSVTSIVDSAFSSCEKLKSVTLPNSITSISNRVFHGCMRLTDVTIPNSVTSIGSGAFEYCESLTGITIPNSVTSIGTNAFADCKKLADISIPNSVTSIGGGVFFGCESLTDVTIPDSVTSIDNSAFSTCINLKNIMIPKSVTSIGNTAFYNCPRLTISCYSGSTAQLYAEANGIKVKLLDDAPAAKPAITAQPKSVTVNAGQKATFKVIASGAASFQWYYRNSSSDSWKKSTLACAATNTFSFTAKATSNGRQFRCLVKNENGSVYSKAASLTVSAKPVITTQPKSVTVNEGGNATFKAAATGAESYQWYYRTSASGMWKKCSGSSTAAAYSLTAAAKHSGCQFRCLVKNNAGSVYTSVATLTVTPKPVISTQPKSITVNEGVKATFKVAAKEADSYQWYYRKSASGVWQKVSGSAAATASFSFTAAAKHDGYQYRCLVKNAAGSVYSSAATLTVNPKPVITSQPQSTSVSAGKKATFKVAAEGAESCQWYYRKSASGVWQKCSGSAAATASFSLTATAKHNGYQYRCLVKNAAGSVYTSTATLTVK